MNNCVIISPVRLSEQARHLVEKLLVHAKSTELNVECVDMCALLESSKPLLESYFGEGIELRLEYPDDPIFISADRTEMQVILNLTLNAVTAVQDYGQVQIKLWKSQGEMILSVVDDGPGIPNTLREWVIKPFNSTTPSGTGLGLSTVSRIALAGGGQIQIEDSDFGGAKVSVRLPLTDVRPEQDRLPNLPQTDVPSMKILVGGRR